MARTLYAGRTGDTVLSRMLMGDGRIVVGVPASAGGTPATTTLTVWDEPDGIMLTDLLAADGVTPITELVVPAGEIQIPAFYGPDGVTGDLWLKDPDGDYSRLDIGPTGPAGPPGADGTGTVNSVNGVAPVAGNVTLGASDVGAQPSDSDLTAIAALTTTAYGRAFLALANATDAQTALALGTAATANTGTASGNVPLLSTGGRLPIARIASGTPDGTKFVRDDGTLVTPSGGSAGPVLLARTVHPAGALASYSTTSTVPVDVSATNLSLTFNYPTSGKARIRLSGSSIASATTLSTLWSLRIGTTDVAGTEREMTSATTRARLTVEDIIITGTPGASATVKWAFRASATGTAYLYYGGTEFSGSYVGLPIMEAWSEA